LQSGIIKKRENYRRVNAENIRQLGGSGGMAAD
jgi:hypothetical protein